MLFLRPIGKILRIAKKQLLTKINIMRIKILLSFLLAIISTVAFADWKPSGPINLQIGFGAGGSTDILGRAIGKEIEDQYGWKVVVENKPGGGGIAMFTKIAVAKPDGLKIGMGVSMPTLINLVMRGDKLSFDLVLMLHDV